MHSNYSFLLECDVTQDDFLKASDSEKRDIHQDVMNTFGNNYGRYFIDENNWYQELCVVFKFGAVMTMVDRSEKWRSFGQGAAELAAEFSNSQLGAFESALNYATLGVAKDMFISYGDILAAGENDQDVDIRLMPYVDLVKRITDIAPKRLAEMYSKYGEVTRDSYKRGRMSKVFEAFDSSMTHHYPPFSEQDKPYAYRAFDIRSDENGSDELSNKCAILIVDIHT